MRHEPLEFLNWMSKKLQPRQPLVDKETFAIAGTFMWLTYMFLSGATIFCDNRDLTYIFTRKHAQS